MKHKLFLALCLISFFSFSQNSPKREFRGLWICTVYNLDWPSSSKLSVQDQQKEMIAILDRAQAMNLNTVFFQVRAAGDAFYKSKTEPWSHWLTGKQGKAPKDDFDPLAYVIEQAHLRNMEVHAWFNLFRAVSHIKFFPPTEGHFAHKHDDWCYPIKRSKFLNPGIPAARDYLNGVVKEVVLTYDIDGIHLDDYFYHQERDGVKINDRQTFYKYNPKALNIQDWRRENINLIVKGLSDTISHHKPYLKFGISPIPVWRNKHQDSTGSNTEFAMSAYDELYADTKKWIQKGWVDYMIPQAYWRNSHPNVGFDRIIKWWDNNNYNRHVYAGLALYKVGSDTHAEWKGTRELLSQVKSIRALENLDGAAFYRSKSILQNPHSVIDSICTKFKNPSLLPQMLWKDSIPPRAPTNLEAQSHDIGIALSWEKSPKAYDGDTAAFYAIYRFEEQDEVNIHSAKNLIAFSRKNDFLDMNLKSKHAYIYIVSAVDRLHNESKSVVGVYITHHEDSTR